MSKTFQRNVNRKTKPYGTTFKNGYDFKNDEFNIVINKSKERRKNKLKSYQYETQTVTDSIQ